MPPGEARQCIAVADTNALFDVFSRDLLLDLALDDRYGIRWSAHILRELEISRERYARRLGAALQSTIAAMRRRFPEAQVEGYEHLIDGLALKDETDRHVLAAAIRCSATHIVTNNLKDFPVAVLAPRRIEALSVDRFLTWMFDQDPESTIRVLYEQMAEYRRLEHMTRKQYLHELERRNLRLFVSRIRESSIPFRRTPNVAG